MLLIHSFDIIILENYRTVSININFSTILYVKSIASKDAISKQYPAGQAKRLPPSKEGQSIARLCVSGPPIGSMPHDGLIVCESADAISISLTPLFFNPITFRIGIYTGCAPLSLLGTALCRPSAAILEKNGDNPVPWK